MDFKLSPTQSSVVNVETNALVIACPGSGKTKILTLKIAKELERLNRRTDRIAALTFTNRAAEEIDKRVSSMEIDISKLWTGTIHSFCLHWIIRPYSIYITELQKGYSMIDEFKAKELKNNFKKQFDIKEFVDINTRRNREGNYVNEIERHNDMARAYHDFLLENKIIDFDLLLYFSYKVLIDNFQIAKNLSNIFKYFFIDEFQDTQDLQYAIVGEILKSSRGDCKIFLVGDPDQAIFESLGGMVKSSDEISNDIGGYFIQNLSLDYNYRSTQRIIDLYSKFRSVDSKIYSLAEYREDIGNIMFDENIHRDELADKITEIIKIEIANGTPMNEICIMAPRWNFLTTLARKLKSNLPDIEFDAPGLTILPRDRENFWFRLSRIILLDKDIDKYIIRLKWAKEILEEISLITSTPIEADRDNCRRLLKKINKISIESIDTIEYLEKSFNIIFKFLGIEYDSFEQLNKQKNSFFEGLQKRYVDPEFQDVPKNINYTKKIFNSNKGIVVNTCHGLKGEEFHTVIAFGLLRGYLPNWNVIIGEKDKKKEIEESNKLLYVVCSRAKKNIFLFSERGRTTQKRKPYEVNNQLKSVDFEFDTF